MEAPKTNPGEHQYKSNMVLLEIIEEQHHQITCRECGYAEVVVVKLEEDDFGTPAYDSLTEHLEWDAFHECA